MVESPRHLPNANSPNIAWGWVHRNFFLWFAKAMGDEGCPSIIHWFEKVIDNDGPLEDSESIRQRQTILEMLSSRGPNATAQSA